MKVYRLFAVIIIICLGIPAMSQSVGELDRFGNEQIERTNKVQLFPNPSVDFLNVTIVNSDLEHVKFQVHNIIGNLIEVEIEKTDDNQYKINVEDLPAGYYLLAIKDEEKHFRETYKFLKR
ncbi:MAG: T9SS type A sorting domain-containing protein [Fulvivirga sp.]|nr:T9SS type A sorting domain-containing protein [Fulvivirga sp.]